MRCLVCILCLLTVGAAEADLVTYQFSGSIYYVTGDGLPEIDTGQPFSGWFSYASDSDVTGIGAMAFTAGSFQSPVIDDLFRFYQPAGDLTRSTVDFYLIYYGAPGVFGGEADYDRSNVEFRFLGAPLPFFSQLPTDISLSVFGSVDFRIWGHKTVDGTPLLFDIRGQVDALERIPEPAAFALLSLGGLLLRCRRKKTVC